MINRLSFALPCLSLVVFVVSVANVGAQTPVTKTFSYNGITVNPAVNRVSIAHGQTEADIKIGVTNNTKEAVDLSISAVDFKSLNDCGGLAFIGAQSSQLGNKHGLTNWIVFPSPSIHLDPGQNQALPITIQNRDDLPPGGHYAAVLFKAVNPSANIGATHVPINQVVSSLVFLQKLGGEKYAIGLAKPHIPTSWFRMPTNINLFFTNIGNIQEVPYGLVTITDPFGTEVSRGQANVDQSLVLPDSTRLIRVPLIKTSRAWYTGIYHVQVAYRSDGITNYQHVKSSFYYVNFVFFGLVILIILVFGIVVRKTPILLRWTKRKLNRLTP